MALWLKQSTAVTVKIGPFVDSTDGDTAETALTISQADVRLSKNGGNMAQKNNATACTHDELGVYDCPLSTTDTNTLGRLRLDVHESGALSVWKEFMVIPANEYDSLVSGSDALDVEVASMAANVMTAAAAAADLTTEIAAGLNDPTAAAIADAVWNEALSGHTSAGTAGKSQSDTEADAATAAALSVPTAADNADAVWDEALAGHAGAGSAGEALSSAGSGASAADIADAVWDEALSGHTGAGSAGKSLADTEADAATAAALSVPTAADNADAVWDEAKSGHVGAGSFGEEVQAHALSTEISGLNDPTAAAVADAVWEEALSGHTSAGTSGKSLADTEADAATAAALSVPTAAANADAVWDEAIAGHVGAGSFGEEVQAHALTTEVSAVETDTQDIQSRLPAALVSGRIDASVGGAQSSSLGASAFATGAFDSIFSRALSAVEDACTVPGLGWLIAKLLHTVTDSGTAWSVKKSDGTTTLFTQTYTEDATANPVTAQEEAS